MKKNYKVIVVFALVLIFVFLFTLSTQAVNIDEYGDEFDFQAIADSVSDETLEILNELGIDEISFEKIFSIDFSKVINILFDMWKKAFSEPARYIVIATGILILTSAFSSFISSNELVGIIGSSALALSLSVPVAEMLTNSFSVLETLSSFTTVFAGVFCALVSSSGNIALGSSYASLAVVSDTLFSALLSGVSKPAVNAMTTLGFLSCFDGYKLIGKASSTAKKLYISFLGFIATFFSGIVTLKGVLGAGADSLTARGVKFVVGRTVPVVGGAVSDTYSALVSSLSLIKNTVGVFGIVTVVLTVLPTLLQLVSWAFALNVLVILSEFLGGEGAKSMLNVLKDGIVLLGATVIFSAVIFIVSVGVVIFVKGV